MKEEIIHYLRGRIFPLSTLPFPKHIVEQLINEGLIQTKKGVSVQRRLFRRFYRCERCHNTDQRRFTTYDCTSCQKSCTYCRNCLALGRVSTCTTLCTIPNTEQLVLRQVPKWEGTYSPSQRLAAEKMTTRAKNHPQLLYAVCGAGKTEVLFAPIRAALQRGEYVALVSPRTDVIRELLPRVQKVFKNIDILVLYEGKKPQPLKAPLVLATTHQLYRYERAFDAVYVDEADAFPYNADETLQRAVQKAVKPNGHIHFITATATREMITHYERVGDVLTIPVRYHGYPLPEPTYRASFFYRERLRKGMLPRNVKQWLQQVVQRGKPYLLFFASIDEMHRALPLVRTIDATVRAVHASSESREEDVLALRRGDIQGLLTTTILERGVTIPDVQVAVLGAERRIFTKEALIQIGGRVGRSKDAPTGDFILFHHGITFAMDAAKKEIQRLNQEAFR